MVCNNNSNHKGLGLQICMRNKRSNSLIKFATIAVGAYETLHESKCLKLPSQRTLRDYTHHLKAGPGFSLGVDLQLYSYGNVEKCEEYEKYMLLLMDEIHVRKDLVYDRSSGELVGFVNLGETNSLLKEMERSVQ